MTEMKQRSLLERFVGRPMPWLAWVWAVVAALWIIIAFTDPSGFHTFIAIVWAVLAALQITGVVYAKRKARAAAAQDPSRDSATH